MHPLRTDFFFEDLCSPKIPHELAATWVDIHPSMDFQESLTKYPLKEIYYG